MELALARTGRKRKHKGVMPPEKRRRATAVDHGTPELMIKRAAVVGMANAARQEAGDALGVLMLSGHLSETQRAAGARYADLRRSIIGDPHCSIWAYDPDNIQEAESLLENTAGQAMWTRCLRAIKPLGSIAKSELDNIAVFNRLPSWFTRTHVRSGDARKQYLLKRALTILDEVT